MHCSIMYSFIVFLYVIYILCILNVFFVLNMNIDVLHQRVAEVSTCPDLSKILRQRVKSNSLSSNIFTTNSNDPSGDSRDINNGILIYINKYYGLYITSYI